jgi:ankyrin repeat protein
LQKLWNWAEVKLTKKEINNQLLLATDNEGRTACHRAAYVGNLDVVQKLWKWAKEKLTRKERNNFLSQTMREGLSGTWLQKKVN